MVLLANALVIYGHFNCQRVNEYFSSYVYELVAFFGSAHFSRYGHPKLIQFQLFFLTSPFIFTLSFILSLFSLDTFLFNYHFYSIILFNLNWVFATLFNQLEHFIYVSCDFHNFYIIFFLIAALVQ